MHMVECRIHTKPVFLTISFCLSKSSIFPPSPAHHLIYACVVSPLISSPLSLSVSFSLLHVLVIRKETRNLLLRNTKTLPVAWRLSGMEVLGDEFSVSQDQGIIMPNTDFCVQMHFRAVKPVNLRRSIRLEVGV